MLFYQTHQLTKYQSINRGITTKMTYFA